MRTEDMRNTIVAMGGSVEDLPDHLPSTLKKRLIETMGGDCPEGNLPSDLREAFAGCAGQNVVLGDIPVKMETTAEGFAAYVTELVIPEGVTSLTLYDITDSENPCAFPEFKNLKKITLPSSMNPVPAHLLIAYDTWTALYTNLEVVLSSGITAISDCAFSYAKLGKITIPDTVVSIGSCAFECCDLLKEIEIPSSVTTIDSDAFLDAGLTKITVNAPENSIAGAPWGATNATVIWTG